MKIEYIDPRELIPYNKIDDLIKESVTNALRTSVDLIDIHDVEAGSEIDREIKNTGVLLYAG